MVAIQIEKCDKVTSQHVTREDCQSWRANLCQVVTQFGQIKGLIAPNRLNLCNATNTKFDYDKEKTFSSACKSAKDQCQIFLTKIE